MKTEDMEPDVGTDAGADVEIDVGRMELSSYMLAVIEKLKHEQKYAAAHGYLCALHSFQDFAGGRGVPLPMNEVFRPERLKAYEEWLMQKKARPLKPNSVTCYMSSLRAVYNRWMPAGTPGHDAKMFADVHTRVVSQTKRALREWQMEKVLADGRTGNPIAKPAGTLTKEVAGTLMKEAAGTPIAKPADRLHITGQAALDYFRLMFLCRGMPFIDLAHLRKRDLQGRYLVYLRHKTRRPMRVELCPEALRLLRKYGKENPDSPYLLPILGADTPGGWELYKDYQDALRLFNRDLARAMEFLLPGVRISSYTARHTWATLAYHMGLPLGVISQSLGHASIRVTETYLKPFENERLDKANKQLIAAVKKGKWKKFANNNIL